MAKRAKLTLVVDNGPVRTQLERDAFKLIMSCWSIGMWWLPR